MNATNDTTHTTAAHQNGEAENSEFGKGFYLPKNSKTGELLYDIQVGKQRYQGSTGTADPVLAAAKVAEVRANAPKDREIADRSRMTWIQAVSRYMEDKGDDTKTADDVRQSLFLLTSRIGPNTKLRDIDGEFLAEQIKLRKRDHRWDDPEEGKISGARVNRTVTDLVKRVLTHARKRYKVLLPDEPDYAEFMETENLRKRELSDHEEKALREDERDDLMEFIDFLLMSGLRISVATIRWDQVSFRDRVITVGRQKRNGKKKIQRSAHQEIPITPRLEALLKAQKGRHKTSVFTYRATKTGRIGRTDRFVVKGERYPVTVQGFMTSWVNMCARQNIEDLWIHDLRRTAGARMLRATGNIALVSEFLGHSDIRMTKRHYAYIASDDVRKAMEKTDAHYYGEQADKPDTSGSR
ncbi:tyrosine-type recombinase/integrase [Methylobacterium radiotolerans]